MDEMQILVPVTVKSKLTETLKKTLMNEIDQNLSRVDHDLSALKSEAEAKIAEGQDQHAGRSSASRSV